ncbi:hypothetical protein BKA93DRAFT_750298 [Sparassis latifolia]
MEMRGHLKPLPLYSALAATPPAARSGICRQHQGEHSLECANSSQNVHRISAPQERQEEFETRWDCPPGLLEGHGQLRFTLRNCADSFQEYRRVFIECSALRHTGTSFMTAGIFHSMCIQWTIFEFILKGSNCCGHLVELRDPWNNWLVTMGLGGGRRVMRYDDMKFSECSQAAPLAQGWIPRNVVWLGTWLVTALWKASEVVGNVVAAAIESGVRSLQTFGWATPKSAT